MSIKSERGAETIHRELSDILANEVKDHHIKYVTITHVDFSHDFSYAKVYFNLLNKEHKNITLKALEKASGFIRKELSKRIDFRVVPELKFIFDESIEYGMKIEKIIEEIKKD